MYGIEGQVRGLQRMIAEDKYCIDGLTQVNAVSTALKEVAVGLLDEHVRHCVREATEAGDQRRVDEMVTEATRAIERLVRCSRTLDGPPATTSSPSPSPPEHSREPGSYSPRPLPQC